MMETEDFVETSDIEELEELEDGKRALSSSRQGGGVLSPYSPRKRVKLSPSKSISSSSSRSFDEEIPVLPEVMQEELPDGPRYSLRHRKAAQLKPYTVDQFQYKQALRDNPDAIVKLKSLALHHHYPEDRYEEDMQEDAFDDRNNDVVRQAIAGPLLPGRTRTRKTTRDLKEDSESEQEIGDDSDTRSSAFKNHNGFIRHPPLSKRGPLLPGHTRTRKTTRDIKGDPESEQDIGDDSDTRSLASGQDNADGHVLERGHHKMSRKEREKTRVISGDMDVPLLHSGKSFGLSTSIRKGWLYELLVTSTQEPILPPSINSCGFELGPTMGTDKLVSILQDICFILFEFITGFPDVDSASGTAIKGGVIMRVVPLLISWFRKTEDESVFASLREAGERGIAWLVGRIQKLTLPFVDMPILATCWFTVEMCARFGCRLEGQPPTGTLKESAMTLIHLLLQVGLEKPITIVKSDTNPTEPSVPHLAAELWVSLVHLLGECDSLEKANGHIHPFWLLLMTAIQSSSEGQRTNLEASEAIWYTIFSVCALSQYSVHGMTTGLPRLPACWDLVVFALKKIQLNEDPKTDLRMSSAILLQRDKYIGLVMTRCFHLRERWCWKLDDGSILFNQLAVIFRSRKFINLRHERIGYPKFFKDRNWDLLTSYDSKDTAFVVFLKLIVQAAKDDQGSTQGKLSLKVKKLLSLAVPVASLPFSKTNPPTLHELTMFYNRLSAIAIAVYLEPDEYDFRTRQAREYIKFSDADDTTRSAVIDAMMNWAVMMVNREIKLEAITPWIGEMAQVLSVELKETSLKVTADESNQANSFRRDRLVLLSCLLLRAVRHILTAYIGLRRYPDPSLFLSLKPFMHSLFNKEDSKAQGELGLLTDSFFSARSAAMPPPGRPVRAPARVVDEDNGEESQEYGIMNIDWSSVDIPEALAVDNEEKPFSSSNASYDKTLVSILASLGFKWIMYRFLKPYLVPLPPSASFQVYTKQCDIWLRCAVGCSCVETGDHKWDFWFKTLDPHLAQVDSRWVRRIKLSLMLKILRADPMAYLTHMDRFIDTYLHALGSDSIILEKDYVPFLLSIDNLQHPLLCNARCLPERNQESGDYEFNVEQFLALRLPLLRVVFNNLDCLLREQDAGNIALRIDNNQYLAKCCGMFSVMRSTRASLEGSKQYSEYNDFCIKVFQSLREYPTLRMAESMSFWVDLGCVRT